MERKCLKSIGIDSEEYEKESLIVIEDLKRVRDCILDTKDSHEKEQLLLDLLVAIDSLIQNKEAFHMSVSIAISATEEYLTISYYEGDNLGKRIYDDVNLLPTYCIIGKDLKTFTFVRENSVLPNPENRGRQCSIKISNYSILDGIVTNRVLTDSDFSFKINDECLNSASSFVAKLQKRLSNE